MISLIDNLKVARPLLHPGYLVDEDLNIITIPMDSQTLVALVVIGTEDTPILQGAPSPVPYGAYHNLYIASMEVMRHLHDEGQLATLLDNDNCRRLNSGGFFC